MGRIKDWFLKFRRRKKGEGPPAAAAAPSIEIRARHDAASENAPTIQVFRTNARVPAAGESEAGARNLELGKGMRVIGLRNPRRCPICATQGKVVANTGEGGKWKCQECGSVF